MENNKNLINNCKKYLGMHPYNTCSNICLFDPHFYMDMCKKYGKENVDKVIKNLKQ